MSIFKKGDKVFDYAFGWGEVVKIENADYTGFLVIDVKFEGEVASYTIDGALGVDQHPTLSFTEYTLEGFSQVRPKEPLPFKVGDVCYVCDHIGSDIWGTCILKGIGVYDLGKPFRGSSSWQFLALENPLLNPKTKIYTKEDL